MKRKIIYTILILLGGFLIWYFTLTPSLNRDWQEDQKILSTAEVNGNEVTIRNIRNFKYSSTTEYTPEYYDRTFNLDELKKVWFVVEPFSGIKGAAHTFVSFEFEEDKFISISVEARKEKGESFGLKNGLLRQMELMYVAGDENDVIKLRSNFRKDNVYLYPIRTTKEKGQQMFLSMAERMNKLGVDPEFYNILTSTCTTNIAKHVNEITPKKIPLRSEIIFPADSDKLAYELGLIDTDLSFEEARKKFLINDRAEKYADDINFSRKIRN